MSQWDGKSKGFVLGYRIFIFIIRKIGVKAAYILLVPVSLYYLIAYPRKAMAMFYYYRRRHEFSLLKSLLSLYKGYYVFGQVLIDKVSIFSGIRNNFTFEFDGIDLLKKLYEGKNGGVLISSHIGNFQITDKFFANIDLQKKIHIVAADQERTAIKEYLDSISQERSLINFIYTKEDMSHIFEITAALAKSELICMFGDRFFEYSKTMTSKLLGEDAYFPAGVFKLAAKLNVPIAFVYVMKEPNLHYHLFTRLAPDLKHQVDPQAILEAYTKNMDEMLRRYPYQWFNFYHFWKK